jgi:hypothetical protein
MALWAVWALGGCGTDTSLDLSSPPPPATVGSAVTIGGLVQMPNGQVASAPSLSQRLAALAVGAAQALSSANVRPVGAGVLVRLGLQRSDGGVDGPFASASTDAQGRYTLRIPQNSDPASVCRYVVYVGDGPAGNLTRAFVTAADQAQDIDFNSEAAVRLVLDRVAQGDSLCTPSARDLRSLTARVRNLAGDVTGSNAADTNQRARAAVGSSEEILELVDGFFALTPTPVRTPRSTFTRTFSPSMTRTRTLTPTHTPSQTQTPTRTFTPLATLTNTLPPSHTPTQGTPPTSTPTPSPTNTGPSPTSGPATPTRTPTTPVAGTPTATATATITQSAEAISRTCTLRAGTAFSRAFIQARSIGLGINLSGSQEWRFSPPDQNGIRSIFVPLSGTVFNRVALPLGAGFLCARLASDSSGFVDCDGGLPNYNAVITQDHNTSTAPDLPGEDPIDAECTEQTVLPDGTVSRASRESSTDPHPGVCNGPVRISQVGEFAPGGMQLTESLCLRIYPAGTAPTCPAPGTPCNEDEGELSISGTITSGNTSVTIFDVENTNFRMGPGDMTCGPTSSQMCVTEVIGSAFGCENILNNTLSAGRLGFGFPILDLSLAEALGTLDAIGTLSLVCQ